MRNNRSCFTYLRILGLLFVVVFTKSAIGQRCYKKKLSSGEKAFTKTLHYPRYKGDEKELSYFLSANIDFNSIVAIEAAISEWQDSVSVKFVIGKDSKMSNLAINSENLDLAAEVEKAFRRSSCNWIPGGTERRLNVWYICVVYVKVVKTRYSFVWNISISPRNPVS